MAGKITGGERQVAVLKKGHIMICPYNINIGACRQALFWALF
jgi:hypothetical protein